MNSEVPKISVIVCTYNQEKYLAQAIESVMMQKCDEPFEILIGDDCSTDGTGKIADEYQSQYPEIIRVIRPEKNGGASLNMVRLMQAAKGNYLVICDGDDYWLRDDMMQMYVDTFAAHPEVGMICAKAKKYIQEKKTYEGTLGYAGVEDLMTMLHDNSDVAAPTIAFRTALMKKCIAECSWYITNNHFYDSIMAYWFTYNSQVKFIDEEIAAYRIISGSACHASSMEKEAEYARRYFAVKWHFILTHPDICNEELYNILMRDYDARSTFMGYVADVKVRTSKAYKLGSAIINPLRKIQKKIYGFKNHNSK